MPEIDFDKELLAILKESQAWARAIIKKEKPDFKGIESITSQELITIVDTLNKNDNPKNYLKFQEKEKLLIAYSILIALSDFPPNNISETLFVIYLIGHAKGYLDAFKPGGMHLRLWEKFCHSKVSQTGQKKRWERHSEELQPKLAKIRSIAKEKYSSGYSKPHHDLAEQLKKDPEFKDISKKEILKIVGQVAENFGYKSGVSKKTIGLCT